MRIIRLPLTVETPGATYNLKATPPDHARILAIGLIVDSKAALLDHEVTSISNGGREHVTKSTVSATDYYPALGHAACALPNENLSDGQAVGPRFVAWPGRFNLPADYLALIEKLRERMPLTPAEEIRLRFANRLPCQGFSFIRVQRSQEFKIALKRIHGSTSIAYADLVCIELGDSQADLETYDLICGQPDQTDDPHWLGQALILSATAAVADDTQRRWQPEKVSPHALRISHLFAMGHQNNGGTIAYAADYLDKTLVNLLGDSGGRIFPSYASVRRPVNVMAPQLLQLADCWRRLDRIVRWNDSLVIQAQGLVSDYQKDIRLTFYGTLRPQTRSGEVLDAA
ncbi:MAG: hypothetical protein KIT75_03495 [Planctomycetota bacterium]|nr:hypothetical protein [Planctomycetota bacterium]